MSEYHPFNPNPRKPKRMPPPLSCDCQFHILGDVEKYPPRPNAAYVMPTAVWPAAQHMHKTLGIERGVIVQPTTYGLNHSVTLDALKMAGPNYKGCAIGMVLLQKGNERLVQQLADGGIGGVRFNFMKRLNMMPDPADFNRAIDQLRELGWYAKMQPDMNGIVDSVGLYENIEDVPIVIDHMARADVSLGIKDPSVQKVLEMLKKGNFWIMLSNGYRISKTEHPWSDVRALARIYIEAAPDRVIWSSDWPHPLAKKPSPNDTDLLELLYSYTDSEEELQKILVDNPAKLFGFPPTG